MATKTVVFADLTGSTAVFEKIGNRAATRAITALTDWIRQVCESHGGRVVKTLGDGVFAIFPDALDAVEAVIQLQRDCERRQPGEPEGSMQLQVGLACGELVEVDGDCFGDAVNLASRLSDLARAGQILATDSVSEQVPSPPPGSRFHPLGPLPIRGREQPCNVFRIDWQEDSSTDMMTMPWWETGQPPGPTRSAEGAALILHYMGQMRQFRADQFPVHIGRGREAEFVVEEPRVSRVHARIDWHNQSFVLVDMSSNGTCVRFQGAPTELTLRRDECVLHGGGEIALGPDFSDWTVPTVPFELKLGS